MTILKPSLAWLEDPEVFAVSRLPAHSDHIAYAALEEAAAEEQSSLRQTLNGKWAFCWSPNPSARPASFYENGFDAAGWGTIEVPGHIQLQGYGRPQYVNVEYPWDGREALTPPHVSQTENPVGSYLRIFHLEKPLSGKRVVLSFQGVETAFYVWLNGRFIGYSEDSFTPAEFDITDALREGENRLAVEVYRFSSASWLEDQDFWRFSGIFREVYLYAVPAAHIEDLHVNATPADDLTHADMLVKLRYADTPGLAEAALDVSLHGPDGALVWEQNGLPADETATLSIPIEHPALWSAEEPNLYRLLLVLRNGQGDVLVAVPQDVGVRRFEMKDGVMCLNGKRIVFNGVNRHEFDARRGRAVTEEDMLWDIRFLKQNNINAVRTCHYPNQSLWYRLCDRYGIYLIDETNMETHGTWQKPSGEDMQNALPGDRPEWLAAVLDRASSMLERDKNHPSVLIWSCGNESGGGLNIYKMSEYFHEADPTRLVHYEGIVHDRRYDATSDMESQMYTKPEDVEAYLKNDPAKPFILCEYTHAMGNSCGGMELYTRLADRYEKYQGGFIWDYVDQAIWKRGAGEKERFAYGGDFGERPADFAFCGNGIVFADRRPTPKAQEVKKLYESVTLRPDRGGVQVHNRQLFTSTDAWDLRYTLLRNGGPLFTGRKNLAVGPGETVYLPLALPDCAQPGEYVLETALCLKQPAAWAPAGFEQTFGQFVWTQAGQAETHAPASVRIVEADNNVGLQTAQYELLLSRLAGGPVSFVSGGQEYLPFPVPPRLAFWRASTNNDIGNAMGARCGYWYGADAFHRCTGLTSETDGGIRVFTYTYQTQSWGDPVNCTVSYRVETDGALEICARYPGASGLPELPAFGMQFWLPAECDRFRYYGLGPEENYSDRMAGARLGVFENTAAGNFSAYLTPQECGNRMGVRWLEVTDAAGHGLRFTTAAAPFACSVLPYTAQELEQAVHMEDLPPVRKTVVRLLAAQMGVGGDDSWGAPVHPEYCLPADRPLELRFRVEPF